MNLSTTELMEQVHNHEALKIEYKEDLAPHDGGCWFCYKNKAYNFSFEFDTWFHASCLAKEIGWTEWFSPEADIVFKENFSSDVNLLLSVLTQELSFVKEHGIYKSDKSIN